MLSCPGHDHKFMMLTLVGTQRFRRETNGSHMTQRWIACLGGFPEETKQASDRYTLSSYQAFLRSTTA